ncbi:MAG TPA: hypothetical protein VIL46_08670 [Gemmataceae bacterium]
MPTCPSCGIKLTPKEMDSGVCDICGASLTATPPVSGSFRGTAHAYGAGGVKVRGELALEWGTVRTALAAMILGIVLTLLSGAGLGLAALAESRIAAEQTGLVLALFGLASIALMLWGSGATLTGLLLSNAVPAQTGAKKWSLGASFFTLLLLVTYLTLFAVASRRGGEIARTREAVQALYFTILALGVLAGVCWSLFLFQTARALGNRGLAAGCAVFLVASLINAGALFGLMFAEVITEENLYVAYIDLAVFMAWHLALLGMLRSTVTRAILG